MTGLISKIQHYSTKDGPGLRTTVFMMGCNLRCLWCANPENLEHRERVFYFKERCHKCGLCVAHAENKSISFGEVGCLIDRNRCTNLMDMVDLCPFDSYERIGQRIDADTLVKKLERDMEFYTTSNGGVTFSGGEAGLQADFLLEVFPKLKEKGIHICLDTAGLLDSEKLRQLCEYADLVLFDLKAYDEEIHKRCTKVSNQKILENLKMLAAMGQKMLIRMVIVPTYNDQWEDIQKRFELIQSIKDVVEQVDVLKYHIYGVGKYEKLQEEYLIAEKLEVDDGYIERIVEYGKSLGLKVTIGG